MLSFRSAVRWINPDASCGFFCFGHSPQRCCRLSGERAVTRHVFYFYPIEDPGNESETRNGSGALYKMYTSGWRQAEALCRHQVIEARSRRTNLAPTLVPGACKVNVRSEECPRAQDRAVRADVGSGHQQ